MWTGITNPNPNLCHKYNLGETHQSHQTLDCATGLYIKWGGAGSKGKDSGGMYWVMEAATCKYKVLLLVGNRSYCGGHLGYTKDRGGDGNLPWGCRQWGMVWGCLRGASWCIIGGEQSSRGGGEVGGDEEGNPLPKGQGGVVGVWRERPLPLLLLTGLSGVDGGVVGVGRERPIPLPLHDEGPPGLDTKVLKA